MVSIHKTHHNVQRYRDTLTDLLKNRTHLDANSDEDYRRVCQKMKTYWDGQHFDDLDLQAFLHIVFHKDSFNAKEMCNYSYGQLEKLPNT